MQDRPRRVEMISYLLDPDANSEYNHISKKMAPSSSRTARCILASFMGVWSVVGVDIFTPHGMTPKLELRQSKEVNIYIYVL